jgi:hypothetical protein
MTFLLKHFMFLAFLCLNFTSLAQDSTSNSSVEIDITSNYVWRDFQGNTPNWGIQPNLDYQLGKSNFTLGQWINIAHNFEDKFTWLEATISLSYTRLFFDSTEFSFGVSAYPNYYFETDSLKSYNRQLIELTFANQFYNIPGSPLLNIYYHPTAGLYSSVALEHSFSLFRSWELNLGFVSGGRAFSLHHSNGLTDVRLQTGLAFPFLNLDLLFSWHNIYLPLQKSYRSVFNLNIALP